MAPYLRLPRPGRYFASNANFSATEHMGMMQIALFCMEGLVDNNIVEAVVQFIDWYKASCRVEYHTDASLKKLQARMKK